MNVNNQGTSHIEIDLYDLYDFTQVIKQSHSHYCGTFDDTKLSHKLRLISLVM